MTFPFASRARGSWWLTASSDREIIISCTTTSVPVLPRFWGGGDSAFLKSTCTVWSDHAEALVDAMPCTEPQRTVRRTILSPPSETKAGPHANHESVRVSADLVSAEMCVSPHSSTRMGESKAPKGIRALVCRGDILVSATLLWQSPTTPVLGASRTTRRPWLTHFGQGSGGGAMHGIGGGGNTVLPRDKSEMRVLTSRQMSNPGGTKPISRLGADSSPTAAAAAR